MFELNKKIVKKSFSRSDFDASSFKTSYYVTMSSSHKDTIMQLKSFIAI